MEQLYNQMAQLIQSGGVELYKEGDKKTIGKNTYTFHNGEWILDSGGSRGSGGNPPPTVPTDFSLKGEHEEGDTTKYEGVIYTWHNGQWVDPNGYPFGYAGPKPFN